MTQFVAIDTLDLWSVLISIASHIELSMTLLRSGLGSNLLRSQIWLWSKLSTLSIIEPDSIHFWPANLTVSVAWRIWENSVESWCSWARPGESWWSWLNLGKAWSCVLMKLCRTCVVCCWCTWSCVTLVELCAESSCNKPCVLMLSCFMSAAKLSKSWWSWANLDEANRVLAKLIESWRTCVNLWKLCRACRTWCWAYADAVRILANFA